MKQKTIIMVLLALLAAPLAVHAVEPVDFEVRTTKNLLNLCMASPEDNLYAEAINFCHGYLVGAYHYHEASRSGSDDETLICVPDPRPTRNETVHMFVEWANENPHHHGELPVETQFRFLIETWSCE